jgi:peptidoglycan hydrolase-like protein with peptidoglycan-binding domain
MLRTLAAVLLSFLAVTPVFAGGLDAAAVNGAAPPAKVLGSDKLNASIVKLQILLDRAHFSPGEIDGKLGENAQKALSAFAETNELDLGKAITPDLWNKLTGLGDGSAIVDYKITDEDLKGPFLKKLPAKMEDMKYLQALNYTSPREALAEK